EEAGAVRGFEIELDRVGVGAAGFFDKAGSRLDTAGGADGDEQLASGEHLIDRLEGKRHPTQPDDNWAQPARAPANRAAFMPGQIVVPHRHFAAGGLARL